MKPSFWSVLGLCAAAACGVIQRQVRPTVRPARIPPVSPPIHARALLLIAPSFEAYVVEERISIANLRTHLGEAGTSALSALVTASFVAAGTRRLADVDVLPLLAGPADTSGADFLLAPSLNSARERHRQVSVLEPPGADRPGCEHLADLLFHKDACTSKHTEFLYEVTITVKLRSLRTGRTFTWALVGRSDWVEGLNGVYFPSPSQTGSALEDVLHVLSDSLAAHRAELEEVSRAS